MVMSGEAAMEKVRRYRAIASLHRQTAAFRPLQRWSLLDQAEEWERLAVAELEAYFDACSSRHDRQESLGARGAMGNRSWARSGHAVHARCNEI